MSSLYCAHFRLEETPFSIAPDPRFVYLSERHREALGHLLFGLAEGGGFVQLTGEVGTVKTTICRTLLCQLPDNIDVALIFNPKLTVLELLQSICEELRVELPDNTTSTKAFVDRLYHYLLDANAMGRRTVLIVDEAQNLSSEVLEQIRLLTNLETDDNKLLQVFLIGQPELRTVLGRDDLRQLAQRVTARYHLEPLSRAETSQYIAHRLSVAGCKHKVFTDAALRKIFKLTGGIPRIVNNLCDRALLGTFATGRERVDARIVARANRELHGVPGRPPRVRARFAVVAAALAGMALVVILAFHSGQLSFAQIVAAARSAATAYDESAVESATSDSQHAIEPDDIATSDTSATTISEPPVQLAARADDDMKPASPIPISVDPSAQASPTPASFATSLKMELTGPDAPSFAVSSPQSQLETPVPRTLREIIDTSTNGSTRDPEQRLLALWGIQKPIADGELCHRAVDSGLACLASTGSWHKIRGFDLPALLSLETGNGETIQALLVGLAGQHATLYVGGEEQRLRLHDVDRYWTGDFLVLWKPPMDGVTVIRRSHSGKSVRWLRGIFARVDGIESDVGDDSSIDGELLARIKNFQRRRGLKADGIVGPETLIHLEALGNDPKVPMLSDVGRTAQNSTGQAVTRISKLVPE
jgi:general secretion pathway protein A